MTVARVVAGSRPMAAEDVADRLSAIADTYGATGDPQVVVCDGFGCKVTVRSGALCVADGVGEHRRERRYAKVAAPERLVVRGDGFVTTEALRWCKAQGCAAVILAAGDVVLSSSPPGRDDPRIRRAQALATTSGAGLAITRRLLAAKLGGQAGVLRAVLGAADTASTLDDLAGGVEVAGQVEEARQLEAVAAAAYFAAWAGHPATAVRFVAKDRRRVPPHWSAFDSRRSAITGAANTNRLAERPANALLNYCYRLAEIEARFACVRLGLDPGLGVLHTDAVGRDSLALDLIEPVRPTIDRFVLELIAERTFAKREFVERSDGHVRCAAPLTHELARTLPTWRRAIAPHAEAVAHAFADEVAGKIARTTPLTGAKGRAASAEVRRRKAEEARTRAESANSAHAATRPKRRPRAVDPEAAASLFATCVDCGGPLTRSRNVRCPACWENQPAQSRDARKRRGRSIAMARSELERWKADHPHAKHRPEDFAAIRSGLAGVTLAKIAAATGMSKASASTWRSGRQVPALRHWPALASLAGSDAPDALDPVSVSPRMAAL
ncbi:MAG: CRISPR-associated endonuclease Cas1 [Actinomycetota bacterium]|nr:CRISPR-associated endonuclease Cas1 [Actinomycetota bacterium]